jgi:hypothetical protein
VHHKTDKKGRPVFYVHVGQLDPVALLKLTTETRLQRNHLYEWEELLKVTKS